MEERPLKEEEKRALLAIARKAVIDKVEGKEETPSRKLPGLERKGGAFVTLHKKGELRGCIGIFESGLPLYKTIAAMAVSAAFKDPRFSPLQSCELEDIDFEISVLSPLRETKDIGEIEIGRHGIYVTKGGYRGVLLPQVAVEYGWDVETFLSRTCIKAGLSGDEWKRGVKIEIFSAQIFAEKAIKE
ncbi:MAG: AmmeMemoRadiSam system protein A [Deltaproteobacteria bacterium]|nr:AmmeMemoRadiSam system protein A [Deltaproteobacteria bacterium]